MAEEENEAIEFIKKEIKNLEEAKIEFSYEIEDESWLRKNINELDKDIFYKNTILNLIEKLQKENEKLNNRDTSRLSEIGRLRTKNNHLENEIKYYYIPKDEIEKIKNKNIGQYMNFYREIEELLEEE